MADRGPAAFAVSTATLVLGSVFVIARIFSRIYIVRQVGWDDYLILLAVLIAIALTTTIDLGTRRGLGRRDVDINADDMPGLHRCEYAFSVLYNPALMATKTSILVFYIRLSKNTQKVLRGASWAVLVVVNLAGAVLTLLNIFQCRPIDAAFGTSYPSDVKCISLLTEFICAAPVNIVTDLAILALPIPVLTAMRLPRRQKTILVFTFTLGIFVTIVAVVRVYYLQQAITAVPTDASNDPSAIFGDSRDFAWNASLSLMWSAVEVNVGITCACIPTLKPLIIKILPAMLLDPTGVFSSTRGVDSSKSDESAPQAIASPSGAPDPTAHGHRSSQDSANGRSSIDAGHLMTAADFLAAGTPSSPTARRARLQSDHDALTLRPTVTSTRRRRSVYFGFVNMDRPKSMLQVSASDSWKYCGAVTVLFFLWGFSYGLLNTLNNAVAVVADMSLAQTLGLTSMYFGGGYFFGPLLVGEWLLRHDEHRRVHRHQSSGLGSVDPIGGFKTTFIAGLLIYGTGTIMFWPSAVLASFAGFMICNFVVGFGLGVLETGANPFLALCGPPGYEAMRLLLAQGVQGVGSVLSGLLAENVYSITGPTTTTSNNSLTLLDVQWTYMAITLFCVSLALLFYYMPLPEVTDQELSDATERLPVDVKQRTISGLSLRTVALSLAVAAQWTYVAGQESMSIFFGNLLTPSPGQSGLVLSTDNYLLIAHTAFAISRFLAGGLAYLSARLSPQQSKYLPSPRTMLLVCVSGAIVFAIIIAAFRPSQKPNLAFVPIVLFFLAEGPLWPLIFALGLTGQGKRTKRAAAYLTMGASGPLFWPFVMYAIINRPGGNVQIAFILVVALLFVTLLYPVFLTISRKARSMTQRNSDAYSPGLTRRTNRGGMATGAAEAAVGRESETSPETGFDPQGLLRRGAGSDTQEKADGQDGPSARKEYGAASTPSSPAVEHRESRHSG